MLIPLHWLAMIIITPFTVPKSHQGGAAVIEEDSKPDEQERNVPVIDVESQEVEGIC